MFWGFWVFPRRGWTMNGRFVWPTMSTSPDQVLTNYAYFSRPTFVWPAMSTSPDQLRLLPKTNICLTTFVFLANQQRHIKIPCVSLAHPCICILYTLCIFAFLYFLYLYWTGHGDHLYLVVTYSKPWLLPIGVEKKAHSVFVLDHWYLLKALIVQYSDIQQEANMLIENDWLVDSRW